MADPMIALRLQVVKTFSDDLHFTELLEEHNSKKSNYVLYFLITIKIHSTDYFNFTLQEMEEKRDGVLLRIYDLVSETEGERRGLTAIKREMMFAVRSYLF